MPLESLIFFINIFLPREYMADIADVVSAHDVKHHAYADDTQLYLRCRAQEATTAAHRLEVCSSLMLITQSFCGPGRDMVQLSVAVTIT